MSKRILVYTTDATDNMLQFRWVIRGPFVWRGRGILGSWITVRTRCIKMTMKVDAE